ncbi:MAG: hypothetical protein H6704_25560 [Myxococcales bacterium]|nr:hypothetical protein [Myxococcales bacterium]
MLRVVTSDLLLPAGGSDASQAIEMGEHTKLSIQLWLRAFKGTLSVVNPKGVTATAQGSLDLENWVDVSSYYVTAENPPPTTEIGPTSAFDDVLYPYVRIKFTSQEANADVLLGCSVNTYKS